MNRVLGICVIWLVVLGGGLAAWKYFQPKSGENAEVTPPNNTEGSGSGVRPGETPNPGTDPPQPPAPSPTETFKVPYILWGGDVAMFYANGGLRTTPESIFGQLGLSLELVEGNDFDAQVERYRSGESPFLRGTLSMLGQKSAVINADPKAPAVVFLQLSWSAGDHMVAREGIKTLADLKGKTIALQRGGPHVGMLDDVRWTAGLEWSDFQVVWTDDVAGDNGPASRFRSDPSVDACFVISPEMTGLTGGLEVSGSGNDDTVQGSHVLVSTAQMSRSIADVYACRKDFFDTHRDLVERFVAGYLKACEQVLEFKAESDGIEYGRVKAMTQEIFGTRDIPTLEDADGLISDCSFVGLAGNRSFFTDASNPSGFRFRQKFAIDLAVELEGAEHGVAYAKPTPDLDYAALKQRGGLYANPTDPPARFASDAKEGETIFSFKITFGPNASDFEAWRYQEEFDRVIHQASLFGQAAIFIRGHTDPTQLLRAVVGEGQRTGLVRVEGVSPNRRFFWMGQELKLEDTPRLIEVARSMDFPDVESNPKALIEKSRDTSRARAERVYNALFTFAESQGLSLAKDQVHFVGLGYEEPVYPWPQSEEQMAANRRVEFRISKTSGKAESSRLFPY